MKNYIFDFKSDSQTTTGSGFSICADCCRLTGYLSGLMLIPGVNTVYVCCAVHTL